MKQFTEEILRESHGSVLELAYNVINQVFEKFMKKLKKKNIWKMFVCMNIHFY